MQWHWITNCFIETRQGITSLNMVTARSDGDFSVCSEECSAGLGQTPNDKVGFWTPRFYTMVDNGIAAHHSQKVAYGFAKSDPGTGQ